MKSENECCSRTKRGTETQIIVIKLFRKKKWIENWHQKTL